MRTTVLALTMLVLAVSNAAGQGKTLPSDPLTGLPLIPATDAGKGLGNAPVQMPPGRVCASAMQGNFYSLHGATMDAASAWCDTHLSGFKKVAGSVRQYAFFSNSDRTILVIVTGHNGSTNADSVAYERYHPGLSEKAVASMANGKIVCK